MEFDGEKMKKVIIAALIAVFAIVGCKGNKEKELEDKISKLEAEKMGLEQYVSEVTSTLNEIQDDVNRISTDAQTIKKTYNIEQGGKLDQSQKDEIKSKLEQINQQFAENKKKFDMLKAQVRKQKTRIGQLEKLINGLEKTIKEKEQYIMELEEQVKGLNIQVTSLKENISSLESRVSEKDRAIDQKNRAIDQQNRDLDEKTKELNTGFYVVGSVDELRDKGVVKKEGKVLGLGGTLVVDAESNKNDFTEIDITKRTSFTIASSAKSIKILPARSSSSYEIKTLGNDEAQLVIKDIKSFWKTKYLVIVTD